MNHNKTAILVFANSAEKELISKSIKSLDIFDLLNTETLKTVKKTGLPYFHFSEKEQIGNSFSERFTNAIETIYNKGFKNVISVGNDTPHLTAHHILKAAIKLESSDFVLGPSADGGFYLMGFKKTHFNKARLKNLPWQTSKLQHCLNKELKQQSYSALYLERLSDIDHASDIDDVLKSFKTVYFKIRTLLLKIRKHTTLVFDLVNSVFHKISSKTYFNKGSPISLHI